MIRLPWRWLKRAVGAVLMLVMLLVAGGIGYEQWSRSRLHENYAPPGERFDIGAAALHLNCRGVGDPTVILEAGLTGFGSMHWFAVQPEVERFTRVCTYDRAGIMWSDAIDGPRTIARMVDELHALLDTAGVPLPYVMVGHSFGGPLVRMYDKKYAGEVAGFVFVDSPQPDQRERMPAAAAGGEAPPTWLLSVLTGTGVARLMPASPSPRIPDSVKQTVQAYAPYSTHGMFAEIRAIEASAAEAAVLGGAGSLGARPVIVMSRGVFDSDPPGTREAWVEMQSEIAALSLNTTHRTINGVTHNIHIEAPEIVVTAIRDVVLAVLTGRPVPPE